MAYIEESDIQSAFDQTRIHFNQFYQPFDEFERLARNQPHASVAAKGLPTVTDGTLAAVAQAQPRRVIQQLPTGRVTSIDDPDLAPYANYIWQHGLLPNMNTGGSVYVKSVAIGQRSLWYGSQPSFTFYTHNGSYFGSDFILPYIKDVYPEVGKLNANDSKTTMFRTWWTESQVKQIISKEKSTQQDAKADAPLKEGWDLKALAKLLDMKKVKPQEAQTANERKQQGTRAVYIELVHVYQEGIGAMFYTYSPDLKKVVRRFKNKHPLGALPINWMYSNMDSSNPFGRGIMETSGGMQNLLDSEVQAFQLTNRVMQQPPLMKWGDSIDETTIKIKPNAVWDMGNDPNAKIEPFSMHTEALTAFPNNYGLIKSQILNLTGNQDFSISSQSGNPSYSKTQAGVKAQQERVNVDDNFFRKNFEDWFGAMAENALNIHFATSSGTREIELTEDFLSQIQRSSAPKSSKFKIDDNRRKATIIYNDIKSGFRFKVDPSSSEAPNNDVQMAHLKELLGEAGANMRTITYFLNQSGYDFRPGELYRQLFSRIGVEDLEVIMPKMDAETATQAQQAPFPSDNEPPRVSINASELPPVALSAALAAAGINVPPEALAQGMQQKAIQDAQLAAAGKTSQAGPAPQAPKPIVPYNEAPEDVKRQMEAKDGYQPSQTISPAGTKQFEDHARAVHDQALAAETAQEMTPEDEQFVEAVIRAGFTQQQATEAARMLKLGASHDEIMQTLQGEQGGEQL